jgi:hypothetical protein
MPTCNAIAFVADFVIGVGIALVTYGLLRRNMQTLLDNLIEIPGGAAFYLRAFLLVLVAVALEKVITGVHMKPEAHFMEYVWAVAGDLSGVFGNLFVVLLVYLGLITVLVAVLRPRHGK